MKKTVLRVLLSLLIGAQGAGGVTGSVEGMQSIANQIESISDEEILETMYSQGITMDTVQPDYLSAVRAQASATVDEFLTNNPTVDMALEVTAEETGLRYEAIEETTTGGVTYAEGGVVGAITEGTFIFTLLADMGLDAYSQYRYQHDDDFKNSYNAVAKAQLNVDFKLAEDFRTSGGTLEDFKEYMKFRQATGNGGTPIPYSDADLERLYWGNRTLLNEGDYLHPNKLPHNVLYRVAMDDTIDGWAKILSGFFDRDDIDQHARLLYEDENYGVTDRYDVDYADYPSGSVHGGTNFTANEEMARNIIGKYVSAKRDIYIPSINPTTLDTFLLSSGIQYHNFMYVRANGYAEDGLYGRGGTTEVVIVTGDVDEGQQYNITRGTTADLVQHDFNKTLLSLRNGRYHRLFIYSSGSETITHGDISSVEIPTGYYSYRGNFYEGHPTRLDVVSAGSSLFITEFEPHQKTSLVDWVTSNLLYPTYEDFMAHIDSLPSFVFNTIDKLGNNVQKKFVKMPIAKSIKDGEDEKYTQDDFLEDINLDDLDEDAIPSYIGYNMIERTPEENKIEQQKPYETESTQNEETRKPSPSDVITPSKGSTPNSKPTTPTGGGSPVIVPPIVPIGGSASALFSVYNPTASQIDALGSYLWSSNIIELLAKFLQNPIEAVISLHQIYITPSISGSKNIKLGYLDSGVESNCVSNQYESLDCGTIFVPEYYNDARDYTPWTQVQLYLPFIGFVPLSAEDIIASYINVKYGVDVYTGALLASVTVTKSNGITQTLYQYEGNGAVQYPLTAGNMNGIVKGVMGALTGGVVGGVSGATIGGITGALSGGASVSRSNGFGANSGAMGYKKPYLVVNRKIPDDAYNYGHYYGLPANKTTTLSTCSGYTRVKDVDLSGIDATDYEKEQLASILKNGIYV